MKKTKNESIPEQLLSTTALIKEITNRIQSNHQILRRKELKIKLLFGSKKLMQFAHYTEFSEIVKKLETTLNVLKEINNDKIPDYYMAEVFSNYFTINYASFFISNKGRVRLNDSIFKEHPIKTKIHKSLLDFRHEHVAHKDQTKTNQYKIFFDEFDIEGTIEAINIKLNHLDFQGAEYIEITEMLTLIKTHCDNKMIQLKLDILNMIKSRSRELEYIDFYELVTKMKEFKNNEEFLLGFINK